MLTSDDLANFVIQLLTTAADTLGGEPIIKIENNDGQIDIITNDGGDQLGYRIMCSGAALLETQRQGVDERVARRTRLKTSEPPIKTMDKTPHRPADNSPTKTSRGRSALKRQIARNKRNAADFKEDIEKFIGAALKCECAEIAKLADTINPIMVSAAIKERTDPDGRLAKIDEIIHNVWGEKLLELYVGVANDRDGEVAMFDEAAGLLEQVRQWGYKLCWIERVPRVDCVIYKVCGDAVPSRTFMERKEDADRNLILSGDRANIIEIVYQ